jgi:murein DD-endopeptidase MepM/ murein hydrolase activator NlpD
MLKNPLFLTRVFSLVLIGFIVFGLKPISQIDIISRAKASISSFNEISFAEPAKNFVKGVSEMGLAQENSILKNSPTSAVNPQTLGSVIDGTESDLSDRGEIIEYIVGSGETLASIASKFNISLNTILWANNLSRGSTIKVGQKLIILPVSGVLYYVKKGDTLSGLAQTYKGDTKEIIAFNGLLDEGDIFIGDILVIPNGVMPASKPSAIAQIPIGSSYFICPLSVCRITQRLHWYNAVDFDGECGDAIYAAAAGIVQKIKYGWNGGGGNYITILHPNGVVTYYGHILTALVSVGQEVSQGSMIALVGGKPGTSGAGTSTGCHLHFDVKGAINPFAK